MQKLCFLQQGASSLLRERLTEWMHSCSGSWDLVHGTPQGVQGRASPLLLIFLPLFLFDPLFALKEEALRTWVHLCLVAEEYVNFHRGFVQSPILRLPVQVCRRVSSTALTSPIFVSVVLSATTHHTTVLLFPISRRTFPCFTSVSIIAISATRSVRASLSGSFFFAFTALQKIFLPLDHLHDLGGLAIFTRER